MLSSGATGSALIDQCLVRLRELGSKVDRTRRLSESLSWAVPPPPPPSPAAFSPKRLSPVEDIIEGLLDRTVMSGTRAPSRCHECHGPLSGYHKGYAHGVDICELEHYELCTGDILEGRMKGQFWRGCPKDFEPQGATGDAYDSPGNVHEQEGSESEEITWGLSAGQKTPSNLPNKTGQDSVLGFRGSKEDLLLEAEMAELKLMEERNLKLQEVREKKKLALEHFERLSRQSAGEGARSKVDTQDDIQYNTEALRASNRQQEHQSRRERSGYQGPTISEIRNDQFTSQKVDDMMGSVRKIPAFSNVTDNTCPQPRVRAKPSQAPVKGYGRDPNRCDGERYSPRSGGEEPLYKMVTGVDSYGVEFRQLVCVSPPRIEQRQKLVIDGDDNWSLDQRTGCMYRSGYGSPVPDTSRRVVSDSRRSGSGNNLRRQHPVRSSAVPTYQQTSRDRYLPHQTERLPGIVPLDSDQAEQKEGKPKSIASHARDMPVEYAKSANAKNINLAMFMYGAISELHSSRIGIASPLDPGVLEAKLQHLLNVISVTCMNSSPSEFKPVAWSVGRSYHNLVQAKVDSGRETWTDFDHYHRSSPHPAEMVAAEREHRVALNSLNKVKTDKVVEKKVEKNSDHDKPFCTTWNNFEEEGKCRFESEHPGEKCNRVHECKYCKRKYPGSRTKHQERFCKRKQDDNQ